LRQFLGIYPTMLIENIQRDFERCKKIWNPKMYNELIKLDERPKPFECYTAKELWDDDHISKKMLEFHLNPEVEPASRKAEAIAKAARWISAEFNIGPGTRLADFGCGPGLYAVPFAQRGAAVTGIDFSRRSIAHAKNAAEEKGLNIDYVLGNYLEFTSYKRFDLITLIYCDLCALNPTQRKRLLEIFHSQLADGGRLLLDLFSLKAFEERQEASTFGRNLMGGFWSETDYMGFMRTFVYGEEKVVLDKYTIVEPDRKRVIYNWLQYFSLATIVKELEENGFKVEAHYSNVAGAPYSDNSPEIAIVASKA
jgi:SAM-dependent methyltransferase